MKLLADENIEHFVVMRLREAGHDVVSIAETQPGIDDEFVLQTAVQLQVVLLTGDKDFGDLVYFYRLQPPLGIILVRLPEIVPTKRKAEIILQVIGEHETELAGSFTVISLNGVRINKLPA